MRLLVTRPEPEASDTAAELIRRGHEALVAPLLTVSFAAPRDDIAEPGALVVTSRNGVRALSGWPQARAWRGLRAYATGAATARALAALGFRDIVAGGGDGRSLAEVIAATWRPEDGPLVYPAAHDRGGGLESDLAARGYRVRAVEAYRADPVAVLPQPAAMALRDGAVDGILLYSRRTAITLCGLAQAAGLGARLAQPKFFVISGNVAEAVRGVAGAIAIAARPDEDSMMALLAAADGG